MYIGTCQSPNNLLLLKKKRCLQRGNFQAAYFSWTPMWGESTGRHPIHIWDWESMHLISLERYILCFTSAFNAFYPVLHIHLRNATSFLVAMYRSLFIVGTHKSLYTAEIAIKPRLLQFLKFLPSIPTEIHKVASSHGNMKANPAKAFHVRHTWKPAAEGMNLMTSLPCDDGQCKAV